MLEKPDFPDEKILACLRAEYGLICPQLAFLPLGADLNTAVYRVVTADGKPYFVKLRGGVFNKIAVTLPKYLHDQGLSQIIPPLATRRGSLWADLGPYKLILYPFVEGRDGYQVAFSERHWRGLGSALKKLHTTALPPPMARDIPGEAYSPRWRDAVIGFLGCIGQETYHDPVAAAVADLIQAKRGVILDLVRRAERYAQALQAQPPEFVLCHSDIHAGNVFIALDDSLYIVDWDDPILAPKERDLMYVGGAQGFSGHTPQEEETLFYQGYGPVEINRLALAYYRYERILTDIAIYCQQLLLSEEGGEDRLQSLAYLRANFQEGGVIQAAYRGDVS